MSIRVVLVDDQEMIRVGFRMVLDAQPSVDVVGEADDGDSALALLDRMDVDVVLMDIRMPRMDGVRATEAIRRRCDPPRVIVLTTFDLDEHAYAALRAGASAFLLKDTTVDALVAAIHHVHEGDAVVAPSTTRRLLDQMITARPSPPAGEAGRVLGALTPREGEVFRLVARGLSNAEIAERLVLTEGTVKVHVGRILTKLDLRDRVQAVVLAYESGVVEPGSD